MMEASDLVSILSQLGFGGILLHNCFYEPVEVAGEAGGDSTSKEYEMKVARLCVQLVCVSVVSIRRGACG